jgi:hypothetical protein
MKGTTILATVAAFTLASALLDEPPVTRRAIDYGGDSGNNTLEARGDPPWPGWLECSQGGFKKPCNWSPTGGLGALDCHVLMYGGRSSNPGMSFGPDKGVTCRFYDTKDCSPFNNPLNVEFPGGDLLKLGRDAKTWGPDDVEGFWSFRCRSYKQKDDDERQSKYIKLPKKP